MTHSAAFSSPGIANTQPSFPVGFKMEIKNIDAVTPFITKDSSEIRELLAHRNSDIRNQSLAEARVPIGATTIPHYHRKTEEIYFITHGNGVMTINGEVRDVGVGDAIAIPPGATHQIENTGSEILRLLCCCSPPYEHDDTILLEKNERSTEQSSG